MIDNEPALTTCPEDIPEGRTATEPGLDLSDLEAASPAPVLNEPVMAHGFDRAVALASHGAGKALTAAESRELAAAAEAALTPRVERMQAEATAENPRLAPYDLKVRVIAVRRAPPGFYKEPAKIVQGCLDSDPILHMKGKDRIASLRARYPGHSIPDGFMSKKLHRLQSKHIRAMLSRHGVAAAAKDCLTLSKAIRRLKDHRSPPEYDTLKADIRIARDGSHVLWNGKRYSVFLNGSAPSIKRNGKTRRLSRLREMLGE